MYTLLWEWLHFVRDVKLFVTVRSQMVRYIQFNHKWYVTYSSITNGMLHTVQSQMVHYIQFNHKWYVTYSSITNGTLHTVQSLSVSLFIHPRTLLLEKCGPHSWQKYWKYAIGNDNMTMNSWYIIWMNEH
jgi:hypothetical protein